MATLFYDMNGNLQNVSQQGEDVARIADHPVPFIRGSQLQQYAAIVYSEAGGVGLLQQMGYANPIAEMEKETFAIALTMFSYAKAKGAAFKRANKRYGLRELLVDSSYTHGINSPAHHEYFGHPNSGDPERRRLSTLAVINLFALMHQPTPPMQEVMQNAGHNTPHPTMYWDGMDLFTRYRAHYRAKQGFELSNPNHGRLYSRLTSTRGTHIIESTAANPPKNGRNFTFMSMMGYGGSIFFRLHDQAIQAGITW